MRWPAQQIVATHGTTSADLRAACKKALRRLVHDRAGQTRIAAADALALFGPDPDAAADLAAAATADNERDVRFAAARALLKVSGSNDPSAGRTLVALVSDAEPIGDRSAILDSVMSAGDQVQEQAIAALARLLADVDLSTHGDIVECLAACGPRARAALPVFERLLSDEDPAERAAAGIAIAAIEGKESERVVPILLKMIDDVAIAAENRQAALEKIRELNEAELVKATSILIRQLASRNAEVRRTAIDMLGAIIETTPAEMPAPPGSK
jgi:HEAT repeats